MTTLTQQPASYNFEGVSGAPISLLLTVAVSDSAGNPIPWSAITNPVVLVTDGSGIPIGVLPTITSPASGQWLLSWSAVQTPTFQIPAKWSLSATVSGTGPWTLMAGSVFTQPSTAPGSSTPATASLSVDVGTNAADVTITVGAPGAQGPGISIVDNGDGTLSLTPIAFVTIVDDNAGLLTLTFG